MAPLQTFCLDTTFRGAGRDKEPREVTGMSGWWHEANWYFIASKMRGAGPGLQQLVCRGLPQREGPQGAPCWLLEVTGTWSPCRRAPRPLGAVALFSSLALRLPDRGWPGYVRPTRPHSRGGDISTWLGMECGAWWPSLALEEAAAVVDGSAHVDTLPGAGPAATSSTLGPPVPAGRPIGVGATAVPRYRRGNGDGGELLEQNTS